MLLFLLSWIFASSHIQIPSHLKTGCDLSSLQAPIWLIGETHFSVESYETEAKLTTLATDKKIHFLIEKTSTSGATHIDHSYLRTYLNLSEIIRGLREESIRFVAIQWLNILLENKELHASGLTKKEADLLQTLLRFSSHLNIDNAKYRITDVQHLLRDELEVTKSLLLKLFRQYELYAANMSPIEPFIFVSSQAESVDEMDLDQLEEAFISLDKPRELFMTQKILDFICNAENKNLPVLVVMGSIHLDSVADLLQSAEPQIHLETYNINWTTYFLFRDLNQIETTN